MQPSVRERIGIGFKLSRAAVAVWRTDRFWSYLSWWHEEIHYTIPADELQRELESLFNSEMDTVLNLDSWLGTGTVTPNTILGLTATDDSSLSVSVPDYTGTWKWESISVQTKKRPHLLRRWVMGVVLGAKWEEKDKRENLTPEYQRLTRFLEGRG